MKGIILAKNEFKSSKGINWVTFDILLTDKENFGRKEYSLVKYWVKKEEYKGDLEVVDFESLIEETDKVEVLFDDSKRIVSVTP